MAHLTTDQLDAGLEHVLASPTTEGTLDLLVARPDLGEREVLESGELVVGAGLAGDNYIARGSSKTPDGKAHPEAELNLMSSRSIDLVADGDRDRWALAGDQLFVDLLFSDENTPPGTRLGIGTAVIEITAKPHNGCAKFSKRFGIDAARWINHRKDVKLRGVNAIVVEAGVVAPGDTVVKL